MNDRITGTIALLITLTSAQFGAVQMMNAPGPGGVMPLGSVPIAPPNPAAWGTMPGSYPVRAAVYAQPAGAPSQIQLASCPSCAPAAGGPIQVAPMGPGYGVPIPPTGYGNPYPMQGGVDCYGAPCPQGAEGDPGYGGECYGGNCSQLYGGEGYGGEGYGGNCGSGCCGGCGGCAHCAGWWHRLKSGCGMFAAQHLGYKHGPYGDGGCCLPRWFDVHAEWLYWTRDFNDSLQLASQGILGPDALNLNDLDFDNQSGFRITWAYPIAPASALEVTYFGQLNWASSAVATGDYNLFSVFSDFGSSPLNGYPQTDYAALQSVSLSTELDNGELNLRHRWISANCLIHSSWLVGARYLRLQEDMIYQTETQTSGLSYRLKTDNDLVGAQMGTDLFLCLTPRFKIGGEIEAGIYGNNARQRTNIQCPDWVGLKERNHETDVAFIGEAGVMALFRVTPRLTGRAGYQALFLDGVALAADNFNTVSPFSARTSFIDNDGNIVMHGATVGFEWTW